jgi:mitochondrial import receptor subunit TOM40
MTSPSFSEKDGLVDLPAHTQSELPPSKSAYLNVISPLTNAWNRYSEWRTGLGLPNPGTAEQLQKEVKGTLFEHP